MAAAAQPNKERLLLEAVKSLDTGVWTAFVTVVLAIMLGWRRGSPLSPLALSALAASLLLQLHGFYLLSRADKRHAVGVAGAVLLLPGLLLNEVVMAAVGGYMLALGYALLYREAREPGVRNAVLLAAAATLLYPVLPGVAMLAVVLSLAYLSTGLHALRRRLWKGQAAP